MHAGDAMAKKATLDLLRVGTLQRGKYLVLIGGSVGAVTESYGEGMRVGGEAIVDSVILPAVHPAAHDAVLGKRVDEPQDALGVIETTTVVAVVHAADAGVKTAEVAIPEIRLADGLGGKGLTLFAGTVANVEAAVAAGLDVVKPRGVQVRSIVIPAIDVDMRGQVAAGTRFFPSQAGRRTSGG
jgi:microcompartment protein CcmL/EutN